MSESTLPTTAPAAPSAPAVPPAEKHVDSKAMPDLVTPFWSALPQNVNPAQQQVFALVVSRDPRFASIVARLPTNEVKGLLEKAGKSDYDEITLRAMITLNRHSNRICNHCWNKSDTSKLLACSACHMTFYCSKDCQKKDWDGEKSPGKDQTRQKHKDWCCCLTADADDGPLQVAVVKMK